MGALGSIVVGVRQRCIMSPSLYNVYMDEEGGNEDGEEGSEIPGGGKRVKIAWPHVCR